MTADAGGGTVDLVVALAAPRAAAPARIAAFAHEVAVALAARAPAVTWRLVVASPQGTEGLVQRVRTATDLGDDVLEVSYVLHPGDTLDVPYHGQPGRARAVQAILRGVQASGARACIVLDTRSTAPASWLEHLVKPLLGDGADFVTPIYARHPFAGALVHGVVYPVFRALYGARVRYPIATEFGCSRTFVDAVLPEPVWEASAAQLGIDLWLSATAATNEFKLVEASLGRRVEERTGLDLSGAVVQVVGTLFADMAARVTAWQRVRGSRPLPRVGTLPAVARPRALDVAALADSFRLGSRELQDVWAEVLPPAAILQWRRLAAAPLEAFHLDEATWARTVYDFAAGYRQAVISRDHLLQAFTPLYLGWLASFVLDVRENDADDGTEAPLERLCQAFETEKPYLISQWRWPERFRPMKLRR